MNKVLFGFGALALGVLLEASGAAACEGGSCAPVTTAAEQSNTTSNYAAPTASSTTTANPVGYATGVLNATQINFQEGGRSTFEGVVNLRGGTSIKGAVSCGNNSANIAAFPGMTGDNRWVFTGGVNIYLVRNTIDCKAQQEIVECAQLFALGSSGSYYEKRCGKFGFRQTPVAVETQPIELRTSSVPATSTLAPNVMDTSSPVSRSQVRQRF